MPTPRKIPIHWRRLATGLLLGGLLGGLLPAQKPHGGDADVLRATAERYRCDAWPQGQRRGGMRFATMAVAGYVGSELVHEAGAPMQRWFEAVRVESADAAPPASVGVEVEVAEDAAAAQHQMLHWLAHLGNPTPAPRTDTIGLALGDVAFVGWAGPAGQRFAWLAFVRGNVAVRVTNQDPSRAPQPDLPAIAQAADALILAERPIGSDAPLPRPRILQFEGRTGSVSSGESMPLVLQIDQSDGAPAAIAFVLSGAGQGYVEADERGVWQLHATRAGDLQVTVRVTGARGVVATADHEFTIGERRRR